MKRQLSYRVGNLQGIGAREKQDDAFGFVNALDVTQMRTEGLFAVVTDGMGGMADGKRASETALHALLADFEAMNRASDLGGQLREAFIHASSAVYDILHAEGGTTAVAGIFFRGELIWASVGDSYLLLLRDGELLRLNQLQTICTQHYAEAIRSGSTDPTTGRADRENAAITQFIGMPGTPSVDGSLQGLRLHDGDVLLLCSDGVGAALSEEQLISCLTNHTPEQTCRNIEGMLRRKSDPFQDNYTALVVQCSL